MASVKVGEDASKTAEEQLNEAKQTIAALTLKVAQLQSALDDKETQFRDLIRRYAKRDRDAHAKPQSNGVNKSANGSATNVSSSGVSIQSNGEAGQGTSSAVSPSGTQNRSLIDSATQTINSDGEEVDSDELLDANDNVQGRSGFNFQRQVSFGFPTSPKSKNGSADLSFATDPLSNSQKLDKNGNLRAKQQPDATNTSNHSQSQSGAKHSRTPSASVAITNPNVSQTAANANNRVSYAEYASTRRNETEYLSLASFASINQTSAPAASQPAVDNDTDDSTTITMVTLSSSGAQVVPQSEGINPNRMSSSVLPAVIPVPIPVRIDSARRPDSLNWPISANGAATRQPAQSQQQQMANYVAVSGMQPQPQSLQAANIAMSNYAVIPGQNGYFNGTQGVMHTNGNGLGANQRVSNAIYVSPAALGSVVTTSPAASNLNDKQDLAMRCLDLPVVEWKAGHVMAWLEFHAGLQPFSLRCAENVKSGIILNSMTDAELEQLLGIEHALHKRKLQLALAELRTGTYNPHLKVNSLTHSWVARTWLREIGLTQYALAFEQALVDGRLLTTLTKKDLEKYLHVEKKSHQASIMRSVELLRKFSFDVQSLAERRARCEYVNADMLVWTNRRLSVWLDGIDMHEFSKVEQTGLNGAYIVYEGFTADSLCNALHISSSKALVRKHLEAKLNDLMHAPVPSNAPNGETMNGNGLHNGAANASKSFNSHHSAKFANGTAFNDAAAEYYNNTYNGFHGQEQLDYINLDGNAPKASSHKSRNYVALENGLKDGSAARSQANRSSAIQQTLVPARPMRNAEQRSKDSDLLDRERHQDSERNGAKFSRSASASRSSSRKMAGLRNSIGKAFSKKTSTNTSQNESDRAN